MGNFQDWSVGIGKESVFRTPVTPTRWLELTDPKPFTPDRGIKQGAGIRVGSRVARSGRRVKTTKTAAGDLSVELFSKGLGLLIEACMGSGTSTVVSVFRSTPLAFRVSIARAEKPHIGKPALPFMNNTMSWLLTNASMRCWMSCSMSVPAD